MPPSKQARARQARQKERLAASHARREVKRRRRKRLIAAGVVIVIVSIVGLLFALGNSGGSGTPTAAKPNNNCAKFNDTLPKGVADFPLQAGPKPTKLVIKDLKVGTGAEAKATSKIDAQYTGVACSTGKIFQSSYQTGQPLQDVAVNGLIKGWQQGIPGMKVGGSRFLAIPADLAYGNNPPPGIEANEPLFFIIDLTAVK